MEIVPQVIIQILFSLENENERLELDFLRKKVPMLEKNLKEGSTQNIPELKEYFGKFEPTIEVILKFVLYQILQIFTLATRWRRYRWWLW